MAKPTFDEESFLWNQGIDYVVGVDEVGRGAFAGPVVSAAVIFSPHCMSTDAARFLPLINDSKLLSAKKREILAEQIITSCAFSTIATVPVATINRIGIHKATFQAFRNTISVVRRKLPDEEIFVLADGFHIPYVRGVKIKQQKAIIKGDRKSISIAAASIIAKVYRDSLMTEYHNEYTAYNFVENKGYGTKAHQLAIQKYGLTRLHRTSFNLSKFLPTL